MGVRLSLGAISLSLFISEINLLNIFSIGIDSTLDLKEFKSSFIVVDTLPKSLRVGLFFSISRRTLSDAELLALSLRSEFITDFKSLLFTITSSSWGVALLRTSFKALFVLGKIISSCLLLEMLIMGLV